MYLARANNMERYCTGYQREDANHHTRMGMFSVEAGTERQHGFARSCRGWGAMILTSVRNGVTRLMQRAWWNIGELDLRWVAVGCLAAASACVMQIRTSSLRPHVPPPAPPAPPPIVVPPRSPPPPVSLPPAPAPLPQLSKPAPVPAPAQSPTPAPAPNVPAGPSVSPNAPVQPPNSQVPLASKCGHVVINGEPIFADCWSPGYGRVSSAQRALLPRASMRSDPARSQLPDAVDHRAAGTEGPIRSQGSVGACTAFSFASAVDHALAVSTGAPGNVSTLHVWARYHTPRMELAEQANMSAGLTSESNWPWSASLACSWFSPQSYCDCQTWWGGKVACAQPVPESLLAANDARADVQVTDIHAIPGDSLSFREALAAGQDIWFGMQISTWAFLVKPFLPGVHVISDFDARSAPSGHALLVSGYKTQADGVYFLLHNSWGRWWGEGGYAWIHETTLFRNLGAGEAYVVEATSQESTRSIIRPAARLTNRVAQQTCPAGLVPDSVTGQCSPQCSDASPRHAGVCPVPGHCPPGLVNLFGLCVPAAPARQVADPATRIIATCGAGGCNYRVPNGVGGCTLAICDHACAAPKYHLTSGPLGFGCSE